MADVELTRQSAVALRQLLLSRQISASELLGACVDVIERENPGVNALVTLTLDAAADAARVADQRLAAGRARPLEGLPVAIKDTTLTAGIRTTFGMRAFADHVPAVDHVVVQRLRAGGAVIVGKSNVPDLAAGSHTVNDLFGATRNPYDLTRSAGGSTGGGAAALASGMVALADGSDFGGSLRNPASFCNVVGLRPRIGRVPNWPSADAWGTMVTSGAMGRTVADVALMLSVVAGPDRHAPLSCPPLDLKAATAEPPGGLRIAWSRDLGGLPVDAAVLDVLAAVRPVFEGLGWRVVDLEPDLRGADTAFRTLRAFAFHLAWGELLDGHRDTLKPEAIDELERGRALTMDDLVRAQRERTGLLERFVSSLQGVDVLAAPTVQLPPFPVEQSWPTEVAGQPMADYLDWMRSCWHLSPLGWPAVSVPAGFTAAGLPVGIQLVADPTRECELLQVANAFERATGHWRVAPSFSSMPAGTP